MQFACQRLLKTTAFVFVFFFCRNKSKVVLNLNNKRAKRVVCFFDTASVLSVRDVTSGKFRGEINYKRP